jgi:deoxyribodipyrimidine photo-lyase
VICLEMIETIKIMGLHFITNYLEILKKIEAIDPVRYGRTRNYINGEVTYLSPYISRGVISTKMVLEVVMRKGYKLHQIESFVKELCWRDYFQRVAQGKNPSLSVKQEQADVLHHEIPVAIVVGKTGIEGIDTAIQSLYENGYMHNHCRMYTAFLTCNLAKSHWHHPAQWMYYHLLDGDWASNALSWQWVAGANSSKKYYTNQDNINKYAGTLQAKTYLDKTYEELAVTEVPSELTETHTLKLTSRLPATHISTWNNNQPAFVYNYYNLDPLWHEGEIGNRVLLLDPAFFEAFPVSDKCIEFVLQLGQNISNLQIFVGSFDELKTQYPATFFHYKEHPLNKGYVGTEEARDWICPGVSGYYPSFFSYWKKAERQLSTMFKH